MHCQYSSICRERFCSVSGLNLLLKLYALGVERVLCTEIKCYFLASARDEHANQQPSSKHGEATPTQVHVCCLFSIDMANTLAYTYPVPKATI